MADDAEARAAVLEEALARGHEGVMVKALDAPYAAGRRGAGWLKVKPVHTLDLVVLAAEWGHGRRRGWLSQPPPRRARRPEPGEFVMLGKTFKGLTDEMLAWQTERLLELATDRGDWVVHVRPELVVEIAFDGVQTSSRYPGGVALRFARVLRHRPDKRAEEADTLAAVLAVGRRGLAARPRSSVDDMRDAPAHDPLADIRGLYDAWNAGNVARAAAVLSPAITWESFGATPHGLQEATLAGGRAAPGGCRR